MEKLLNILLSSFIVYSVAFVLGYFIREYFNIPEDSFFTGIVHLIAYIWVAISVCLVILFYYMIVTFKTDNEE